MILSIFIVFFCFRGLVANSNFAKMYALFGVNFFCLKFGWCKQNYIFHVWSGSDNPAACPLFVKDTAMLMGAEGWGS